MYLYNLVLQEPTAITYAIYGNFSNGKAQEIIASRGSVLQLLRPDAQGKIQTILSHEVFGVIRSLMPFRLTGGKRDYIIVGTDSGRITILQYNDEKNVFDRVHLETFGKSGCRRIVPGQYLAIDPKGRAVMIGAIEKQKLVYILNRDAETNLTISSPLEAHKASTIAFHIVGIDVGFENPQFAVIEVDYSDADLDPTGEAAREAEKNLTIYELDLGLNHVVRKSSEPIDSNANMLVTVPGGADGPGGVVVCAENSLYWISMGEDPVHVPIPRRKDMPEDQSVLIVSSAVHKQKGFFFILLQSELGDLYKVTFDYEEDSVEAMHVNYFDTVPVANSLCIIRTGFLFVASEFGNHFFYQFKRQDDTPSPFEAVFTPHELENLVLIDELESLSPVLDAKIGDVLKEDRMQLYAMCGRGPRSSLRVLRHGLAVTEIAAEELPALATGVWSIKEYPHAEFDKYIVVSFANDTLVLSIGETVEEVTDSGFKADTGTLNVGILGESSFVQIYPKGIRHIRGDKRKVEWNSPGKKTIVKSAINEQQVVVALSGGEVLYFELDARGSLEEVTRRDLGREISCLEIAPVPDGDQRARFLAVGDYDNTVRILSLYMEDALGSMGIQALPAQAESLCILEMRHTGVGFAAGQLYLNIGLSNGVLLRSVLDSTTGELSDTRTRFLGARPVKLFPTVVSGHPGMIALSSRPWLCYNHQQRFQLTPLSYDALDHASGFSSPAFPEAIVALSANTLRIVSPERLGTMFNQEEIPLRYTPRKLVVHPTTNHLITLETDHNAPGASIKGSLQGAIIGARMAPHLHHAGDGGGADAPPAHDGVKGEPMDVEGHDGGDDGSGAAAGGGGGGDAGERRVHAVLAKHQAQEALEQRCRTFGAPRPGPGAWASCLRIINMGDKETLDVLELDNNEAAHCMTTCTFHDQGGETVLVVGTCKDLAFRPKRTVSHGYLHVYRLLDGGRRFELVHKTQVESIPGALCEFNGRLLAGVGNKLRIYDMGKRQLLRKCEKRRFPNLITSICAVGDRIVVGDIAHSFHFVQYRKGDNQMVVFADDVYPRRLTASCMLDYSTMAGADKFGNVFVLRLPDAVNEEVDANPTGGFMYAKDYLNGAPYKLDAKANFHVGDLVTSLQKATMVTGGQEALIYTTMMGGVGALVPLKSREDVDFFHHLEMHLRTELPPLCGRDHLAYRSYYFPVKDVIDGSLCEQFSMLAPEKQRDIADALDDRTPGEVMKKLEVIRNSLL